MSKFSLTNPIYLLHFDTDGYYLISVIEV